VKPVLRATGTFKMASPPCYKEVAVGGSDSLEDGERRATTCVSAALPLS
jgi:hypothetical protein